MANVVIFLAQQGTSAAFAKIVFWASLLAVLVVVMVVAALFVRRRVLGQDDTTPDYGTFTMADLRQLRDEGKLSETEYERARQALVANQLAQTSRGNDSDNGSGATGGP